ncbi:MAG: MBL fold metallo-hydrolase [Desulfurococcaceae archaeon]
MPRKLIVGESVVGRRGYAGIVVWFKGKSICIDPGSEFDECSVVLCTHMHPRHCKEEYLTSFNSEKIPIVTSKDIKPGEELNIGDIKVLATHAYNKPELYNNAPLHYKNCCVGYVLILPRNIKIYYMGDTNFIEEVLTVGRDISVLIPPIGGGSVMTPEEALEVVRSFKPAITIPVHYDKMEYYYKFRDIAQPYTQVIRM